MDEAHDMLPSTLPLLPAPHPCCPPPLCFDSVAFMAHPPPPRPPRISSVKRQTHMTSTRRAGDFFTFYGPHPTGNPCNLMELPIWSV